MVGAILAGGENRRMPVPKAFLPVGDSTIIERTVALLRGCVDRVMIVTRTPGLYAGMNVDLVGDVYPWRGPMTGIVSALSVAGTEPVLVTACDMPFLDGWCLRRLLEVSSGYDMGIPTGSKGIEPLCGVYAPPVLPALEKSLLGGQRSIQEFVAGYNPERVLRVTPSCLGLDPEAFEKAFVSVNTPRDYAALLGGRT